MRRQSQAWKNLEREAADILKGRRVTTPWSLFEIRTDVIVDDFPELAIDAKYRQRWAHHSYVKAIIDKYGAERPTPVLITKAAKERGAFATIPLALLAELLNIARVAQGRTESPATGKTDNEATTTGCQCAGGCNGCKGGGHHED